MVKSVINNHEKYRTYKEHLTKYNLAMENEFYFEAIIIIYAMMEDRLTSFLYHINAIKSMESTFLDVNKTKRTLKTIYSCYNQNYRYEVDIEKIADKRKLIESLLKWSKRNNSILTMDNQNYADDLKCALSDLDIDSFLSVLDEVKTWCVFRNNIIHALMHKNIDSVYANLKEKVENGMQLARYLDKQVRIIKKENKISLLN